MSNNYFETKESRETATYILESYDCSDLLNEGSDSVMLDEFIDDYNWDDGFEVPYFLSKHKNCELGTALKMFYLGDRVAMLYEGYNNNAWKAFSEYLYKKISEGNFKSKIIEFKFHRNEKTKERIKESGWPEVFIEDIII